MELGCRRVFLRVGCINAVHTSPFQHHVCLDFDSSQWRSCIGSKERISRSCRHDDDFTVFHVFDRFPLTIKFADRFHADCCKHTGFHPGSYQGRTQCQTIDNSCEHPHLVAFHTVESFIGSTQTTENVSSANHDADLYALFMNFFDLFSIFCQSFFINAILLFAHKAFSA